MPENERQSIRRLFLIIPKNPPGLIITVAFSVLLIVIRGIIYQLIAFGLPNSLSTLVSLVLIYLYFIVYIRMSETRGVGYHLSWYVIITISLVFCVLAWFDGGIVWLWYLLGNIIDAIPQILDTGIFPFFLYYFTACILCSFLYLLLLGWIMKAPMIRTVVRNHASILLLQSIIIAAILIGLLVLISFIPVLFDMNEFLAIALFFIFHISYVIVSETKATPTNESAPEISPKQ